MPGRSYRSYRRKKRRMVRKRLQFQSMFRNKNGLKRYRGSYLLAQNTGFPRTKVVTMKYSNSFSIGPTGMLSAYDTKVFGANTIFTVDVLAGTHHPLGYDQWSQFYEKYVVLGSKFTVCAQSDSGAPNNVPILLCLYRSDTPNPNIVISTYIENNGKYILFSPTTNGNSYEKWLVNKYSAKRQHNITDIKDCESLEALFGADPIDMTYYNLTYVPYDGASSTTTTLKCVVSIEYIVMLKDPKPLPRSV